VSSIFFAFSAHATPGISKVLQSGFGKNDLFSPKKMLAVFMIRPRKNTEKRIGKYFLVC